MTEVRRRSRKRSGRKIKGMEEEQKEWEKWKKLRGTALDGSFFAPVEYEGAKGWVFPPFGNFSVRPSNKPMFTMWTWTKKERRRTMSESFETLASRRTPDCCFCDWHFVCDTYFHRKREFLIFIIIWINLEMIKWRKLYIYNSLKKLWKED